MAVNRDAARLLLAGAVVVLLLWIGYQARHALLPFGLALALAYIIGPSVELLARRLPRSLALLIVLLSILTVVGLGLRILLPVLAAQVAELGARLPALLAAAEGQLQELGLWWDSLGLPEEVRRNLEASAGDAVRAVANALEGAAVGVVLGLLQVAAFLFALLIVPVWVFYLLRDRPALSRYIARVSGTRRPDVRAVIGVADRVVGGWLRAQFTLMVAVGAMTTVAMYVLGSIAAPPLAAFALVLGVIAGVTNLLPIIGPFIGAIPAVVIALATDPITVIWVIVAYTVIQQFESLVLVPNLVGGALALHPTVLIVALLVGGTLFGLLGAILAAPTVAFARAIYRYTDSRLRGLSPSEAYLASDPMRDPA